MDFGTRSSPVILPTFRGCCGAQELAFLSAQTSSTDSVWEFLKSSACTHTAEPGTIPSTPGEAWCSWALTSHRGNACEQTLLSSRKTYSLGTLETAATTVPYLAGSSRPLEPRPHQPHPLLNIIQADSAFDACVGEDSGSQGLPYALCTCYVSAHIERWI